MSWWSGFGGWGGFGGGWGGLGGGMGGTGGGVQGYGGQGGGMPQFGGGMPSYGNIPFSPFLRTPQAPMQQQQRPMGLAQVVPRWMTMGMNQPWRRLPENMMNAAPEYMAIPKEEEEDKPTHPLNIKAKP